MVFVLFASITTNDTLAPYELSAGLVATSDLLLPPDRRVPAWWRVRVSVDLG